MNREMKHQKYYIWLLGVALFWFVSFLDFLFAREGLIFLILSGIFFLSIIPLLITALAKKPEQKSAQISDELSNTP